MVAYSAARLVIPAPTAKDLQEREEDVDRIEVDRSRELHGRKPAAAVFDAREIHERQEREDHERSPREHARMEEMRERADDAENHERDQEAERDAAELAIIEARKERDRGEDDHPHRGRRGGVDDDARSVEPGVRRDRGSDADAFARGKRIEHHERQRRIIARPGNCKQEDKADDHRADRDQARKLEARGERRR